MGVENRHNIDQKSIKKAIKNKIQFWMNFARLLAAKSLKYEGGLRREGGQVTPPRPPPGPETHVWGRSSVESRPDRRWARGVRPPPPWGRCTPLVRPWAAVGASCGPTAPGWSVGVSAHPSSCSCSCCSCPRSFACACCCSSCWWPPAQLYSNVWGNAMGGV